MLGGGGFTGGVYEIGALRALDLLSVNRTVNEFDVYVGTSAGSFVAALAANGITPEEMMRVVNRQVPTPFRDVDLGTLLRLNFARVRRQGAALPFRAAGLARTLAGAVGRRSRPSTSCIGLAEGLPSGLYSGAGIEHYVRTVARRPGPHRRLPPARERALPRRDRPRHLRAHRVRRARAGTTCRSPRPCAPRPRCRWSTSRSRSRTASWSTAGIVSTTNLDIAVEAGAKLVVVVNPLVPYVNDFKKRDPDAHSARASAASSDMGFPQIGYQTFKLLAYQRLHEMARRWEERYPGVDIVLIEPEPNDELMFQTSIMNYASRVRDRPPRLPVGDAEARRGLRPASARSATRHGIEISATRVRKVVKHFAAEQEQTPRLAQDPRADDRHAAAAVGVGRVR